MLTKQRIFKITYENCNPLLQTVYGNTGDKDSNTFKFCKLQK